MKKLFIYILTILAGTLVSFGVANADPIEYGKNRPGGDFTHFSLIMPNAELCRQACVINPVCKAWTFVNPGVQGPQAQCWLKSSIPAAQVDPCCVSGTKTTSGSTFELNTNRGGGDYTSVVLPSGSQAAQCRSLCLADGTCLSWTFVKAGYQGPNPRCWLKSSIPAKTNDVCCTSGVK